jgi:oligopeptide/dipeptide ABC transporter ATP-binding protein
MTSAAPADTGPGINDGAGGPLLRISDLHVSFHSGGREAVAALRGVSLDVGARETVAIVGESGSGKSTAALSVLGLLPRQRSSTTGQIVFAGRPLSADSPQMRKVRGAEIAMVFQDPMTALNPTLRVGHQIAMALRAHTDLPRPAIRRKVLELLTTVGLTDVTNLAAAYPHSLSGGMSQRVVIALALSCSPRLLIADEPTTALDVTIQAQILQLLQQLQADLGLSILLITHDLGVVAEMANRVFVMYSGKIVESGSVGQVLTAPEHPYTQALLEAMPRLDRPRGTRGPRRDARSRRPSPTGCSYQGRCPISTEQCAIEPALLPVDEAHWLACWNRGRGSDRRSSMESTDG